MRYIFLSLLSLLFIPTVNAQQKVNPSLQSASDSNPSDWSFEADAFYYIMPNDKNTTTLIGSSDCNAFHKKNGVDLWIRILKKLSLITNISSKNFGIYLPVSYYDRNGIYVYENDGASQYVGYPSGSSSVHTDITDILGSFTSPKIDKAYFDKNEIINDFEKFVNEMFLQKNANVEFLTKEKNMCEVIIRGLKSEVIKGSNDWEKIQIILIPSYLEKESGLTLLVDGCLSSGIGGYPPDTQFTKSMEPAYKGYVDDYAKNFITKFKNFLENNY